MIVLYCLKLRVNVYSYHFFTESSKKQVFVVLISSCIFLLCLVVSLKCFLQNSYRNFHKKSKAKVSFCYSYLKLFKKILDIEYLLLYFNFLNSSLLLKSNFIYIYTIPYIIKVKTCIYLLKNTSLVIPNKT